MDVQPAPDGLRPTAGEDQRGQLTGNALIVDVYQSTQSGGPFEEVAYRTIQPGPKAEAVQRALVQRLWATGGMAVSSKNR